MSSNGGERQAQPHGARTAESGWETVLHLQVQRFRCGDDDCGKKTFAPQVAGLTVRYGERDLTTRLTVVARR
ncbi:hypothetical protein [Microtetraspora fusca]|uniref:hypothetical protein n=1 Tax=Microtetraspora fusca TaxID=1997 RepID=UPI000B2DF241|nr:hypothetical protein [Microtetraspora fusca]